MAKHFDLSDILQTDKPSITIGDQKFVINNEKPVVLSVNAMLKKEQADDIEAMDKALKLILGNEGYKRFDKLNLTVPAYQKVYMAVIACVQDEELEVVEKRFRGTK